MCDKKINLAYAGIIGFIISIVILARNEYVSIEYYRAVEEVRSVVIQVSSNNIS